MKSKMQKELFHCNRLRDNIKIIFGLFELEHIGFEMRPL
jgi:hypothetical protein